MAEAFQPIAVRPPEDNRFLFWARCLVDLQLWTIVRFLRGPLGAARGKVLDVGAGQTPWTGMLAPEVDYVGVDVEKAEEFGMLRVPGVIYYDGTRLPMADDSFDTLICVEVLEHVPDPAALLADMHRVLKPGGQLILTVPWSARVHHIPHDYSRFTRFGLATRLGAAGFIDLDIRERGNDIAVIANKLLILTLRSRTPRDINGWPEPHWDCKTYCSLRLREEANWEDAQKWLEATHYGPKGLWGRLTLNRSGAFGRMP